ncbi:hypothetical protein ACIRPQ_07910 [Streptomyces sp. NPDC101213]|uniref:hypothetical protein n=1 Tax=Streptomyces sp. NPDC101213 TaxID=3366130 RepID=UPI00382A25EB|nr:hypothetical protein [Streptomyces sp. Tue 6430]
MGKRKLRSVLVAAFSAAVAFGVLSGLAGAESDALADSSWGVKQPSTAVAGDSSWGIVTPTGADDSSWG